jgi:superfamily II helicase
LNVLQLTAVNEYRVLDGDSLLVVAPTSSGKTFIGEMASVRTVMQGRKAPLLFSRTRL